jgi:hypothetical protein
MKQEVLALTELSLAFAEINLNDYPQSVLQIEIINLIGARDFQIANY